MTMMRRTFLSFAAGTMLVFAGCSSDPTSPDELLDTDTIDLVPDYALSPAAVIDGAGVGGSNLPEELRLTPEQKADIAALHEAFMEEHADEVAALRELERQIREARRNGATREELRSLFEEARAIQQGLAEDFAQLQRDIWEIYTPEQRAWIEEHRPKVCGPGGPPRLTEEQVAQIRELREAFMAAVADDMAAIKAAHQQAREAHQNGATREEIAAILATVADEMERVRAAERKLQQDILALLTPEQREGWCVVRRHVHPPRNP
jgi:Spy/CpxP family protein refolding chaperone